MAKATLLNLKGEKVKEIKLNDEIFGIEPNEQTVYDAIKRKGASLRQGTHSTKNRSEVSGGGRKPWRQKGTGRARAGSSRSPIWVGGGTVFGPVGNQNYKLSQNKKAHKLALKSALSMKKDEIVVVDEIKFADKKTANFVKMLDAIKVASKALVVVEDIDENLFASCRNVGYVKVVSSDNVSVVDLLNVDTLVMSKASVKAVEEALK